MSLLLVSPAQADTAYFQDINDLPVMTGLSEIPDQAVQFDTPDGRIVETVATGAVSKNEIFAFYSTTVPQLGWQKIRDGVYVRGAELLILDTKQKPDNMTELHIRLIPNDQASPQN